MKYLLTLSLTFFIYFIGNGQTYNLDSLTLIHGEGHVFKVETPQGWIRDTKTAEQMGLIAMFYPEELKWQQVYAFAHGYGKENGNLDLFIQSDLKSFAQRYPEMTYKEIRSAGKPPILASKLISFSNLSDRFKEEVLYLETETAIITLVFAASTQEIYNLHVRGFDDFIKSFQFLGTRLDSLKR